VTLLEQAMTATARDDESSADLAECEGHTQLSLAQALWATGVRASRIADLARSAADAYRRAKDDDRARDAEAWLDAHLTNLKVQ
jgi:hypothetical protein